VHRRLGAIDDTPSGALRWLEERFERVRNHGDARVLARIERVIADTTAFDGATQWLHGDFHLGNLLFVGDRVSAVVDFDDTGPGSALSEAAMALFALSRRDEGEERFVFDHELWNEGLRAYDPRASIDPDAFVPLFCAYQVLVHLEAAQRGWWKLEPGIGFGPCWNAFS
jgi:Ser/Thr protein kinase RdoA (MazF antagonist)